MPLSYFNRLAILLLIFCLSGVAPTGATVNAQGDVVSAKKQKLSHQPSNTPGTTATPFTDAVLRSPSSRTRKPAIPFGEYATNEEVDKYAPDETNDIYTSRPSWYPRVFENLVEKQAINRQDPNGNEIIKSSVSDFSASSTATYFIHEGEKNERPVRIWDIDHIIKFEYIRSEARKKGVSYEVYRAISNDESNLRLMTYQENRSHTYEYRDRDGNSFNKTMAKKKAKELVEKHIEEDRIKQERQNNSRKRRRDPTDGS